jgi:hypothetical protein
MHAMARPYSAVGLINVLYKASFSQGGKDKVPESLSDVKSFDALLMRWTLDVSKSIWPAL